MDEVSSEMANIINNNTDDINLLKNRKFNYITSKKIYYSYKTNGFFSAIIEGRRGIGKSSYALVVLHDIYLYLGYDNDTAWQMAIDRMLYTIPEIVSFIKESHGDKKEVAFCWDDCGVFGSNLRYFSHLKEVNLLQSLMDTIRSSIGGMLLTAPSQFSLLKFLRRYDNNIIQITYEGDGGWYRTAKGYLKYTMPSGKTLIFHKFNDTFSCYLPKDVYGRYMEKREAYNRLNVENLEELMNRKKGDRRK